nr:unnamed protein product [Spirometra erinaceieuropaei]
MTYDVPKPPKPLIDAVSHASATLSWQDFLQRLNLVFNDEQKNPVLVELERSMSSSDQWERVYNGYLGAHIDDDLEPSTAYEYRLRFKTVDGYTEWSDSLSLSTIREPLYGDSIHRALRHGSITELEHVLSLKEANIEAQDTLGFTPLMVCANKGQFVLLDVLLKHKPQLENENDAGKTALMFAAFKGHTECVSHLIEAGARIDHADRSGLSAIHYATDGEHRSTVQRLIELGADPNAKDSNLQWTPLLRCCKSRTVSSDFMWNFILQAGDNAIRLAQGTDDRRITEIVKNFVEKEREREQDSLKRNSPTQPGSKP